MLSAFSIACQGPTTKQHIPQINQQLKPFPHPSLLQVIEAEAAQPLVPAAALASAGALPRVLAQGAAGGDLVAAPAAAARQQLYEREDDQTGG